VIVLDTTVLVYAVGDEHPLRGTSRAVISAVTHGRVEATTTVEVIQEFTHVRARRRGRADAVAVAGQYVDLLAPLARPTESDVQRGLDLYREHEQLGSFDAVLAALVLGTTHLDAIVSADRGFASVRGLRAVDLADAAALEALGVS
jgi:uncharacterized protein